MYQWAINTKDSFVDAAIVYLNHERNGTACDKREKHILCEFLYSRGRDTPSFKTITVIVTINHSALYMNPILQWRFASGSCQMGLCENKVVCFKSSYCLFVLVSSFSRTGISTYRASIAMVLESHVIYNPLHCPVRYRNSIIPIL